MSNINFPNRPFPFIMPAAAGSASGGGGGKALKGIIAGKNK